MDIVEYSKKQRREIIELLYYIVIKAESKSKVSNRKKARAYN